MNIQQQEIINHAFSSKENLHLAICVGQAYDELREKIIRGLSAYIESALKDKGWETNFTQANTRRLWNTSPLANYTGFICYRKSWPENLHIGVESESGNYIIGINVVQGSLSDNLRNSLSHSCNTNIGVGTTKNPNWPWHRRLSEKYVNFNDAETLLLLHEKQEFLDYLFSEIELIESIVDLALKEAL